MREELTLDGFNSPSYQFGTCVSPKGLREASRQGRCLQPFLSSAQVPPDRRRDPRRLKSRSCMEGRLCEDAQEGLFFKGFVLLSTKADRGLCGWGVLCQVACSPSGILGAAPPPAEHTGKRHTGQSLGLPEGRGASLSTLL